MHKRGWAFLFRRRTLRRRFLRQAFDFRTQFAGADLTSVWLFASHAQTYFIFFAASICFRRALARAIDESSTSSNASRAAAISGDFAGNFVVSSGVGVNRSIVARKLPFILPLSTPRLR